MDGEKDHKQLGRELDLFTFSDLVGPGLPLWTPKGTMLRNLLDDFVWRLREERGFEKVEIPHITKRALYETSGHWEKFKEDLFHITTREGDEFAMKPMNCPHHTQIYARRPWSYRELPQRYANTTMVYRDEQSGELNGLSRTRAFTQDDAHTFCRESQVKEEFVKIWEIIEEFYGAFGFTPKKIRLSFRDPAYPEKFLGDQSRWDKAEGILREITKDKGAETIEGSGEAAFYGPKLDFMAEDSKERLWQVATIQLDMNMPERFDLTCVNEKGEKERIVMIHAAIMGSIERFLSVLIDHVQGAFPTWLSPVQARVISISEKHVDYANEVISALKTAGIRADADISNESLGKKIRVGKTEKIPYLLVVGDKEVADKTVSVESRDKGKQDAAPLADFIEKIRGEIKARA
jgi:threonyl-tRNA synthetase